MKRQKLGQDKENKKLTGYFGIAALIFGAALLFSACENDIEKIEAFDTSEIRPVIRAENYETTFTDSGIVRFFLRAPILERFEISNEPPFSEFPDGVEIIRYDAHGNVLTNITARYAKELVREKKWEARNDVVVVTAEGDTLKTDFMIFDDREEKVYNNDEFVKIIRSEEIVTGYGFYYYMQINKYQIKNIIATLYVEVNTAPAPGDGIDSTAVVQPVSQEKPLPLQQPQQP